MWMKEKQFRVRLGGNTFINVPIIILFKGESLFTIYRNEGGYLGIDFDIYNGARQKIASVKRNNIYPHKDHKANLALEGTEDTLRLIDKDTGNVITEIRKSNAATEELDISVTTYLPDGTLLKAAPNSTNIGGLTMTNCVIDGGRAAIVIG